MDIPHRHSSLLASDYKVLAQSPEPMNIFTGSPGLTRFPSGRLIATYEWFRSGTQKETVPDQCTVLTSDDSGLSWSERGKTDIQWATPFVHENNLYMLGNLRRTRDIVIARSENSGDTWTPAQLLFQGRYTNAATPVLRLGRYLYRAFETSTPGNSTWKSLCIAGDTKMDLLDPAAWRMSNHVPYPGTPPTLKQGEHPQGLYPMDTVAKIAEDGWLEGNIVEVRGQLRIILRVGMQGEATANLCGVCDVSDDGEELSNRFLQFYPMPGGQCKFFIVRDDGTGLYWAIATPPTDVFQPIEPLRARGFPGSPGNERRALVLMYSLDALSWFMAGYIALSPNPLEAFSYASLLIDGDNILVLARSSVGGKNQHDTNLITFHRVSGFRQLVPSEFAPNTNGTSQVL